MPNASVHTRDTLFLAAISGTVTTVVIDLPAGLAMAGGCVAGVVLTPDLDQESLSRSEWTIIKRTFGLGFLWVMYWWPYAVLFKHRGISHAPIIGTLTRLVYLAPIWVLLGVGEIWMAWAVIGLMLSDAGHWLHDK